ncbi:hypothetical protein K443DRAFT_666551, partial [Laccaria amethystina LaAM-08-1]
VSAPSHCECPPWAKRHIDCHLTCWRVNNDTHGHGTPPHPPQRHPPDIAYGHHPHPPTTMATTNTCCARLLSTLTPTSHQPQQ